MNARIVTVYIFLFLVFYSTKTTATTPPVLDTNQYIQLYQNAQDLLDVDFESSVANAHKTLDIAIELSDEGRKLQSLTFLANAYYYHKHNIRQAVEYLNQIKKLDEKELTIAERIKLYGLESKLQVALNDYPSAITAVYKQLEELKTTNNPHEIADANYSLGSIHYYQSQFQQSILYYKKALQYYENANHYKGIAHTYDAIGCTYGELNNYKENIYYDSLALAIAETINSPYSTANILLNYGLAYRKIGETKKALKIIKQALVIAKQLDNQRFISDAYNQLGALHEDMDMDYRAGYYYEKSNEIAEKSKDRWLLKNNCEYLYAYHSKLGNHEQAYNYLLQLSSIKDSLHTEQISNQLANNKIKYENSLKQHQNLFLIAKEKENAITIQKQKLRNYGLFLTTLFLIFLAILLYYRYRTNNQNSIKLEAEVKERTLDLNASNEELKVTNNRLKQSNLELERFAYIASHDLKSPLRNIVSFIGLIKRRIKEGKNNGIEEYLNFAENNATQMYSLIQDVLEFSKINNQTMTGWEKEVDLNEVLANVIYNIDNDIKEKKAEVVTCPLPRVKGSKVHLMQLFQNLITNGIKYNDKPKPFVGISYDENINEHIICIEDNGIGIEKQYHDQVFDMFKRLHTQNQYTGTGLGLSICKKVIQDMKGKIWLESKAGEGTSFFISIPKMPVQVMADQN